MSPATCELVGQWRIVEADLWDRDYLDLAGPAYFRVGSDGWAEFAFGAVEATAEIEYGRTIAFSVGAVSTKATKSLAMARPNRRTMAPSKSSCLSTMVTTPSSLRTASGLLQRPASKTRARRCGVRTFFFG